MRHLLPVGVTLFIALVALNPDAARAQSPLPTCADHVSPVNQPPCQNPPTPSPGQPFSVRMSVTPEYQTVSPGQLFTVDLVLLANGVITGAQSDITFDQNVLQITDVQPGAAFKQDNALLIYGEAPDNKQQAIARANSCGGLANIAVMEMPGGDESAPPDPNVFVTVTFQAIAPGHSDIVLGSPEILDATFLENTGAITLGEGQVAVSDSADDETPWPLATSAPSQSLQSREGCAPAGWFTGASPEAASQFRASATPPGAPAETPSPTPYLRPTRTPHATLVPTSDASSAPSPTAIAAGSLALLGLVAFGLITRRRARRDA